jgi:hypothetical protein
MAIKKWLTSPSGLVRGSEPVFTSSSAYAFQLGLRDPIRSWK